MSGHPSGKDDKSKQRDTSPSVHSQTSDFLEWDPSADVGTSTTPHDEGMALERIDSRDVPPGRTVEIKDSQVAGPSKGRPRMSRSRSFEDPVSVEVPHRSQHKSSLGELTDTRQTLVQKWEWTKSSGTNPERTGGESMLETMISGFTYRRQFIDAANAEQRPASNTIVTTIMPPPPRPPQSRSNSSQSMGSDPPSLHELHLATDPLLQRTNSSRVLEGRKPPEIVPDSLTMIEIGLNSTTAPSARPSSANSRTALSEVSGAESRYRARRSTKNSSGSHPPTGGISDYLEVGMTRSEIEYRRLKELLNDSDQSGSMIFLNVEPNYGKKNNSPTEEIDRRNVGIQGRRDRRNDSSDDSSIYHSTPRDRRQNRPHELQGLDQTAEKANVQFDKNMPENDGNKKIHRRNTPYDFQGLGQTEEGTQVQFDKNMPENDGNKKISRRNTPYAHQGLGQTEEGTQVQFDKDMPENDGNKKIHRRNTPYDFQGLGQTEEGAQVQFDENMPENDGNKKIHRRNTPYDVQGLGQTEEGTQVQFDKNMPENDGNKKISRRNTPYAHQGLGQTEGRSGVDDKHPEIYENKKQQQYKEQTQPEYEEQTQQQYESKKKKDRRRERSPPQPFAVATRKSSHRHHYSNHSRNNDTEISSFMELKNCPKVRTEARKSSSSDLDLSPACLLIQNAVNNPRLNQEIVDRARETHRQYHIENFKRELKKLNNIMAIEKMHDKNRSANRHDPRKSSSSEDSSSNGHPKRNPKPGTTNRGPHKSGPAPKGPRKDKSSTSSDSPSHPNQPPREPGLREIENLLKNIFRPTRNSSQGQNYLDKKFDEMKDEVRDAFALLTGMIIENCCEKEKKEETSKSEKKRKSTMTPKRKQQQNSCACPPRPCKPPVAYFVDFRNCQPQYIFRRADIQSFGERQFIDTATRPVSREQEQQRSSEQGDDSAWEDVDAADEDAENRDPEAEDQTPPHNTIINYNLRAEFERRCPHFLARVRDREAILAQIKAERETRAERRREWVGLYGNNDLDELHEVLPRRCQRVMTTREMRELTQRHYKNLPEVREKKTQRKVEDDRRINRLLSQTYSQKVRKSVLKGEVNHSHSRSVLRR